MKANVHKCICFIVNTCWYFKSLKYITKHRSINSAQSCAFIWKSMANVFVKYLNNQILNVHISNISSISNSSKTAQKQWTTWCPEHSINHWFLLNLRLHTEDSDDEYDNCDDYIMMVITIMVIMVKMWLRNLKFFDISATLIVEPPRQTKVYDLQPKICIGTAKRIYPNTFEYLNI